MTDHVKLLVRLLAETDGLIPESEAGVIEIPADEAERMRLIDTEMKLIRKQIESASKKLRAP
jgi:hypothetical protein